MHRMLRPITSGRTDTFNLILNTSTSARIQTVLYLLFFPQRLIKAVVRRGEREQKVSSVPDCEKSTVATHYLWTSSNCMWTYFVCVWNYLSITTIFLSHYTKSFLNVLWVLLSSDNSMGCGLKYSTINYVMFSFVSFTLLWGIGLLILYDLSWFLILKVHIIQGFQLNYV